MTTYRSKRTFARRTMTLATSLAALGALSTFAMEASAAELLTCTTTEIDLRAELDQILLDGTANDLTPFPFFGNPNGDGGRLDDGSVLITNPIVSQIFPAGIPFIDANPGLPGLQRWTEIYANANGNITFSAPLSAYTPAAIPGLTQPTIAAYFGDVDLRAPGSQFALCVEPANDRLFVTWRDVGYYNSHSNLTNSFQIVLTNNDATECLSAANFQVEFRYEQDLSWTTGDASGGVNGLGGTEATAGIDAGDTVNAVALPGSGTSAVLDLDTESNVDDPGVFRFLVAEGQLPRCGDGNPQLCEECDDGDDDNNDTCTNLCLTAACGDDLIHTGFEDCDGTQLPAGTMCPDGYAGLPLCNNDPANPDGNNTCTLDPIPDGCSDEDECLDPLDNDCDVNATCTNTPGSFECDCDPGFTGDGTICDDINECLDPDDNNCDLNATCTNIPGSFTCECDDGFTGDGVTCTPDGTGGGGPGGSGQGGSGQGGSGQGGTGQGGDGQGGTGNGGDGQGGTGNGGNGQGGTGNGGDGQGGAGNGGNGQGGTGGSGQGGSGNGGSGSGASGQGGEGAGGPGGTGGTGTGASTSSTETGSGAGTPSGGSGGSGDSLDGVVASGGMICAVQAPGSHGGSRKEALALLGLAGVVVASRRRRA